MSPDFTRSALIFQTGSESLRMQPLSCNGKFPMTSFSAFMATKIKKMNAGRCRAEKPLALRLGQILPLLLFVLLLFSSADLASAETAPAPDSGKQPPQRIISLTLGTDEILLSLVDPKRIVAITAYAADPGISNVTELAGKVPNKLKNVGLETIVALQPDLVLAATYTSADVLDQLKSIGVPVITLRFFSTLKGIKENIRIIGRAVAASEKAEEIIAVLNQRLKRISDRLENIKKRPGLLSYGLEGWTAGRETTFDEIVSRAGGRNLAAEAGLKGHPKISLEALVAMDPEVLILNAWQAGDFNSNRKLLSHPALQALSAVKKNRVFAIEGKYLTTVSHFIVRGIEEMARLIHPEHFLDLASKP